MTPVPGTTRDLLHETINIDGLPVNLVDTAGLRESSDPVERIGIERAQRAAGEADLLLEVIDIATPGDADASQPHPEAGREPLPAGDSPVRIRVYNKIDLVGRPADVVEQDHAVRVYVSAKSGDGVDALRRTISERIGWSRSTESHFIARRRHLEALAGAHSALEAAGGALAARLGMEIVAEELRIAQEALGLITGRVTTEDLLGEIFSTFCIGK